MEFGQHVLLYRIRRSVTQWRYKRTEKTLTASLARDGLRQGPNRLRNTLYEEILLSYVEIAEFLPVSSLLGLQAEMMSCMKQHLYLDLAGNF